MRQSGKSRIGGKNHNRILIKSAKRFNSSLKGYTAKLDIFTAQQTFEVDWHIDQVKQAIDEYERKLFNPKINS